MQTTSSKIIIKALRNELTDEYLLANSIRLVVSPLPYEIKGITVPIGTWYQITINSLIPQNQQYQALLHELYHIHKCDCFSEEKISFIEQRNPF